GRSVGAVGLAVSDGGGVGQGAVAGDRRRGLGWCLAVVRRLALALEQRVAFELFLDLGGELLGGQLQRLDRLLELRRHDERLALTQIHALAYGHRSILQSVKRSPR